MSKVCSRAKKLRLPTKHKSSCSRKKNMKLKGIRKKNLIFAKSEDHFGYKVTEVILLFQVFHKVCRTTLSLSLRLAILYILMRIFYSFPKLNYVFYSFSLGAISHSSTVIILLLCIVRRITCFITLTVRLAICRTTPPPLHPDLAPVVEYVPR